ncbi:MAG: hypothetical protein Q9170_007812 [Blastenia crenularia]
MSRSRVVLDLLSARRAARELRERPWATVNPQPRPSGIRTRPAMPVSSTSSDKPRLAHCIRSGKAALQSSSSSPKVQSQPFHCQRVPIAVAPTSGARSILDRLQARRDRLATAARPTSDKASIIPGPTKETWTTVRQRHVSPPVVGASHEKQARPALRSRARQASPETLLIESLFPVTSQASPASSITTGRSFSFIAAPTTPRRTSPLRPSMPHAPRSVKFHEVGIRTVSFPALVQSSKALPKGILKKAGENRSTAKRAVTWGTDVVREVSRWIGCSDIFPEEVGKGLDVHPDPSRYLGRLWGWTGPEGEDSYSFGKNRPAVHAECPSPECNKKALHQYRRQNFWHQHTGGVDAHFPRGERLQVFNERHGFSFSTSPRTGKRYPKDRGLDLSPEP